jgi:hypothetical protein
MASGVSLCSAVRFGRYSILPRGSAHADDVIDRFSLYSNHAD